MSKRYWIDSDSDLWVGDPESSMVCLSTDYKRTPKAWEPFTELVPKGNSETFISVDPSNPTSGVISGTLISGNTSLSITPTPVTTSWTPQKIAEVMKNSSARMVKLGEAATISMEAWQKAGLTIENNYQAQFAGKWPIERGTDPSAGL